MNDAISSRGRGAAKIGLLLFVSLLLLIFFVLPEIHSNPDRARNIKQCAQFHSCEAALELFANESRHSPPSDANDETGLPYCGAMKLAEALMGQDLWGVHRQSRFRLDGTDPNTGKLLYARVTLEGRRGPFLPLESARAHRLLDVYGKGKTGPFAEHVHVLCDCYEQERPGGKKTGMPILYYRADVNGTAHDVNAPDNPENIYDYRDNQALIALGVPGKPGKVHPLADPKRFYLNTQSHKSPERPVPYCADRYILISAGRDGLYGTEDDICNFDWKYRK